MQTERVAGFSKRYREAVTQRLWDQWNAIGATGYATKSNPVTWAVDPEALILASSRFFRYEPRLRDIALWWVLSYSGFVSIARLKRMQEEYQLGDADEMADFASVLLASNSSLRSWNSIVGWREQPVVREFAPFQRWDKIPALKFLNSASFILRLRALFGVTSRVEILLWLYRMCSTARELATNTVWYSKTVQKTLSEMSLSGYVGHFASSSPSKEFMIMKELWSPFLTEEFNGTMVVGQHFLYSGVFEILGTLENCETGASDRATDFLILESLRNAYPGFQKARPSGEFRSGASIEIQKAVETLVKDAESGGEWPGGSFEFDPSQLRLA